MINRKLYLVIAFLFLLSCEYQPVFSSKESGFAIKKIELAENNNINSIIKSSLKRYERKNNKNKVYDLRISSQKSKIISLKDSKGDPKIFSMSITVKINAGKNNLSEHEKTFNQSARYNNSANKFDLKRYEKKIEKDLANMIIGEIVIFLQSI